MTEKRKTPPKPKKIIEYWRSDEAWERLMPYRGYDGLAPYQGLLFDEEMLELEADFGRINPFCFACFKPRGSWSVFDRAHIVPHMLGGSNHPSNFVMLCHRCHAENPNTKHEDVYFKWLASVKNYKTQFTDKVTEALGFYGVPIEEANEIYKLEGWKFMHDMLVDSMDECGLHNGINANSFAGVLATKVKEYHASREKAPIVKPSQPIGDQMELF